MQSGSLLSHFIMIADTGPRTKADGRLGPVVSDDEVCDTAGGRNASAS